MFHGLTDALWQNYESQQECRDGSLFEFDAGRGAQFDFLVTAEAIDAVGYELGEGGDVLLVLPYVEDVDGELVARLHHHLARLGASCHHSHTYILAQSQQAGPMLGSNHKVHIIALHPMKHIASLKSMPHRSINPPRILIEFYEVRFHAV